MHRNRYIRMYVVRAGYINRRIQIVLWMLSILLRMKSYQFLYVGGTHWYKIVKPIYRAHNASCWGMSGITIRGLQNTFLAAIDIIGSRFPTFASIALLWYQDIFVSYDRKSWKSTIWERKGMLNIRLMLWELKR